MGTTGAIHETVVACRQLGYQPSSGKYKAFKVSAIITFGH